MPEEVDVLGLSIPVPEADPCFGHIRIRIESANSIVKYVFIDKEVVFYLFRFGLAQA